MADAARCDHCSAHADRPTYVRGLRGAVDSWPPLLPADWVRITARSLAPMDASADQEGEFCSWPCAAAWLTDLAELRQKELTT